MISRGTWTNSATPLQGAHCFGASCYSICYSHDISPPFLFSLSVPVDFSTTPVELYVLKTNLPPGPAPGPAHAPGPSPLLLMLPYFCVQRRYCDWTIACDDPRPTYSTQCFTKDVRGCDAIPLGSVEVTCTRIPVYFFVYGSFVFRVSTINRHAL